jgi:hypothetical protein
MMGLADLRPLASGWVGGIKQNYVWLRRRLPIIWRVFSLFVLRREMLRTRALSVYESKDESKDDRSASLRSYDISPGGLNKHYVSFCHLISCPFYIHFFPTNSAKY